MGFSNQADAGECSIALQERMAKPSLALHPEKTRLTELRRCAAKQRADRNERLPATFDFLSFAHPCGKSREGWFTIHRRTARK